MRKNLLFIFLLISTLSNAQVSYDNNSSCHGEFGPASSLSLSNFTVPANNDVLILVFVRHNRTATNAISSITYNAQNLVKFDDVVNDHKSEIWYGTLGNVASNITSNVDVTFSSTPGFRVITAYSFNGVDQTTPLINSINSTFNNLNTSTDISVSGNVGDMAINAISANVDNNTTSNFTATSGQSIETNCISDASYDVRLASSLVSITGASVAFNWNLSDISSILSGAGINHGVNIQMVQPLPVELVSLKAYPKRIGNMINWMTASEHNNRGFEVQRATTPGDWETLGFVEGDINAVTINDYQFIDRLPLPGLNYYRLKQIDLDGRFEFSDIVVVNNMIESNIQTVVYPNPTEGNFTFSVNNPTAQKMKIQLSDHLGRMIWNSGLIREEAIWKKEFQLDQHGVYFMSIQIAQQLIHERIVVVNKK